jgi:hypothetical protein
LLFFIVATYRPEHYNTTVYRPYNMKFAVVLVATFASQACADLNLNTEAELREEISETKVQIAELRELIKSQGHPEPDGGRVSGGPGDAITAHSILEEARGDFTEDRRRLAVDAGYFYDACLKLY